MQADLLDISHKNHIFSNIVMRIYIDIMKVLENNKVDDFSILVPIDYIVYLYFYNLLTKV